MSAPGCHTFTISRIIVNRPEPTDAFIFGFDDFHDLSLGCEPVGTMYGCQGGARQVFNLHESIKARA